MKKTLLLLLVLIGLGGLYYFSTLQSAKDTTIGVEDRQFISKDKDAVHTITIKAPARPLIHLSKHKNVWYIDGKHKVRPNIMTNMLFALTKMKIKYIPLLKENNTAADRIKKFGLDIKTYDKAGKVLTDFTLGSNTNDEYGTYVRNRGAEQIYVMSIPGYDGGLRNYFTHDTRAFRDLTILSLKSDDLQAISIDYPKDVSRSMVLSKTGSNFELSSSIAKEVEVNESIADAYFKSFEKLPSEALLSNFRHKDTISSTLPFMKLSFDLKVKEDRWIALYPVVDIESDYNTRTAEDVTTRHDKYFVNTSWGDFYKVQAKFLRNYIVTPEYFMQTN